MKKGLFVCVIVISTFLGAFTVWAEPENEAASISFPNKFGVSGLYTLIGTDTLGDNTFSFGLTGDFSEFSLPEDPRTPQLLEIAIHTGFSFNEKFEVGVTIPYRKLDVSDKPEIEGFDESGMGDILAIAKLRILDEQISIPALGLYTQVSIPTGDEEKGLGNGTFDVTFGGVITKHIGQINLYGNVGFLLSGWDTGDPNPLFDNYQNSLLYGVGLEFPVMNPRFRAFSELTFLHEFGDEDDDRIVTFRGEEIEDVVDDAGQIVIGLTYSMVDGLSITGGAAFQILGEEPVPDAPVWRTFLNMSYVFGRRKPSEPEPEPVKIQPAPITVEKLPNQCPRIVDVSLSDSEVNGGEHVRIGVTAIDPDQDKLYYIWNAPQGILTGREAQIVWTAPECSEGSPGIATYDITVDVSDRECSVDRAITIAVNCGTSGWKSQQQADAVILFPSGSTRLNNIAKAQLDDLAVLLEQFPDQAVMIDGHTDSTGSEKANLRVGLQRAESVKAYLVQRHGIDPARITTNSYGSSRPVTSNETQEGRNQNRRAEIYRVY